MDSSNAEDLLKELIEFEDGLEDWYEARRAEQEAAHEDDGQLK